MKKFTLILATVALLAAGCSKTEVVGPQNRKGINFAAYTAKTTKDAQKDVTTENLDNFEVTAFSKDALYFDDVTFTKSTVWESQTKYFWPAFSLTFCAYNTPIEYNDLAHKTGFARTITTTTQELEVSPAAELAYQQDLVAAYAADKRASDAVNTNHSLSLTFNHYLTQVTVKATNENSTYQVVVDGVKIANMVGHGKYTFSENKMTAAPGYTNTAVYTATFDGKKLTSVAQEVMTNAGTGKWYLIPQTVTSWNPGTDYPNTNPSHGTYLALKVKITANNGVLKIYPATGNDSGWMAVPIQVPNPVPNPANQFTFAQGKRYTFTIHFFANNSAGYVDPEVPSELDGDPLTKDNGKKIIGEIKFNATVDQWDSNNNNIEIYL